MVFAKNCIIQKYDTLTRYAVAAKTRLQVPLRPVHELIKHQPPPRVTTKRHRLLSPMRYYKARLDAKTSCVGRPRQLQKK